MSERLLGVDDEKDFGTFVSRVARKLGIEVEVTTEIDRFKELYKSFDPTVIALDIVMPGTDGIELVQWLASMQCRARIIIISGFDPRYLEAAQILGSLAGLRSIVKLGKPVSVADLEKALLSAD